MCIMRRQRYVAILGLVLAVIVWVPRWRGLVLGLVLGGAFSELHLRVIELRVDGILRQMRGSMLLAYVGPLLGLVVLAVPLLCACVFPRYFSWVGVLAGLLARKVALFIAALRGGRADGD